MMGRISQRRFKKIKREDVKSFLHPKVWGYVEADAKKFNVSLSFVIATAVEEFYGSMISEKFYEVSKRKKRVA
jgi:hypothetical protein